MNGDCVTTLSTCYQRFELNAQRNPDKTALIWEDRQLTYGELNAQANQLANALITQEVTPGSLVGLCVSRSFDTVIGILGILKAGAAYVPVDPNYPASRIAYTLNDAKPAVLVTQQTLVENLPACSAKILLIDAMEKGSSTVENPAVAVTDEHLAYVIYTSGSTGAPKGVQVTHKNVSRLFDSTNHWFDFGVDDVWTLFHSYAFDFSVWEIWGALSYGGSLVIVSAETARTPELFYTLLISQGVTVLNQTPSAFQQLQLVDEERHTADTLALRYVIFGGEALNLAALKSWISRHGDSSPQLINMYGITETTVHVTYRPISRDDVDHPKGSLIGRAIPDLKLYLFDDAMKPVIDGQKGELYVAGDGLSKGYLNRPDLTAERFINHTLENGTVIRLYRTGDLARRLSNNELEYLGRIDDQVQLRGFRIELGEIESLLIAYPEVKQVALNVIELGVGDQRLVAYVVKKSDSLQVDALRDYVANGLPVHMVPQHFVFVAEIPLTANGKVDKKALPHPRYADLFEDRDYVAPTGDTETRIAAIWQALLGVERVGVNANFFHAGGHSLLAAQMVARLRREFGVQLSITALFNSPTIAELAKYISSSAVTDVAVTQPVLHKKEHAGDIPLSFMQSRIWFFEQMEQVGALYNIPYAFKIDGDFDPELFKQAMAVIVKRHASMRTTFSVKGGAPTQVIAGQVDLPVFMHDLSQASDPQAEIDKLITNEAHTLFDIEQGPLWRCNIIKLAPSKYVMTFVIHHIVFDGWSVRLLASELEQVYGAMVSGVEPQLPQLSADYADYTAWQSTYMADDRLQAEIDYWLPRLKQMPPVLELPTDFPRSSVQQFNGSSVTLKIPSALHQRLNIIAQQERSSLFMLLLAAYQLLLHRYSSQENFVVGTAVANREPLETEAMLGLFMNSLPLCCDLSGDVSLRELIARVRKTTIADFAHQGLPFDKLVEALNPERDLRYAPVFQVMFIFDALEHESVMNLPGMRTIQLDTHSGTSKYDMTLYMWERPSGLEAVLEYCTDLFSQARMESMLAHYLKVLEVMVEDLNTPVASVPILPREEQQAILKIATGTATAYPENRCVFQLFEQQVVSTPDTSALAFHNDSLSYHELNARANQLAHYLVKHGVGVDDLVGVMLDRSFDMVIALLATWKTGAAYVPLDPTYPKDRLVYMADDAELALVVTQSDYANYLPGEKLLQVDLERSRIDVESDNNLEIPCASSSLAYVIYTSGSTGRPKGVMVEHRNVVNFFAGMDERIAHDSPGVWLAVTSISFDISVLEIFWSLCRGFKLVLYAGDDLKAGEVATRYPAQPIAFSLFYWNFVKDEASREADKYKLLLESAKYADKNGFEALWTPERHFGAFGGLYPNPSVIGAALAATTQNIGIRAGSCVVPLHSPIRIAEEWSVVDNLSNGRAGLSIAPGWQPNDFVIKPENHARAKEIMFDSVETIQQLWKGEAVTFAGPKGDVEVRTYPRPIQEKLPIWVTVAVNPDTFRQAGSIGAHVLTHLLGQDIEKVAENIRLYRSAWKEAGHAGDGQVTLMLHTFIGDDEAQVRDVAQQPMMDYLESAVSLVKAAAWHSPAWKQVSEGTEQTMDEFFNNISDEDRDSLLAFAFDRYYNHSGLFGNVERCVERADQLKEIGVDEIGCLIDFGIETEKVLAHLHYLSQVKEAANPPQSDGADKDYSIAALIERHNVTHFQCTPTMANMLASDQQMHHALGCLSHMMVGGEAFSSQLAVKLRSLVKGQVTNMYGPTETTIWSTTYHLHEADADIPLGSPIANTQTYVLDNNMQLQPLGVPGELVIAGDGVVRGYLNRPELTAEKFVKNSVSGDLNDRMYRTGDLVCMGRDGRLEFMGRIDHQVKLHGYRIELGEIEKLLLENTEVNDALVLLREDEPGNKKLVAYVVPDTGTDININALRNYLGQHLPEFMVPVNYVVLAGLPLLPNGKINRKKLPVPEQGNIDTQAEYVAPASEVEIQVATILQALLGLKQVGLYDNFFEIGGHSLIAVQLITRIRQDFAIDIPLQAIFLSPRLVDFSSKIEQMMLENVNEDELLALLGELEDE